MGQLYLRNFATFIGFTSLLGESKAFIELKMRIIVPD